MLRLMRRYLVASLFPCGRQLEIGLIAEQRPPYFGRHRNKLDWPPKSPCDCQSHPSAAGGNL